MSLIFEALKKLEREKDAPERGVVVVGSGAWGEREPRSRARTAAAVGLLALGLALAAFALRPRPAGPVPQAPEAAAVPTAAPSVAAPMPSEPTGRVRSAETAPPAARLVLPTASPPRNAPAEGAVAPEPAPPPVAPAAQPEFRLNAISSREGHPVALLNDRLVREGDVIEGVRVLHIGDDFVEIEVKGERRTIRF